MTRFSGEKDRRRKRRWLARIDLKVVINVPPVPRPTFAAGSMLLALLAASSMMPIPMSDPLAPYGMALFCLPTSVVLTRFAHRFDLQRAPAGISLAAAAASYAARGNSAAGAAAGALLLLLIAAEGLHRLSPQESD